MRQKILCTIITALLLIMSVIPTYAASSPKVESVSLNIEYDTFEEGDFSNEVDVQVTVPDNENYYLMDTMVINAPVGRAWAASDNDPILRIVLSTKGDYIFAASSARESGIDITSNNTAEYSGAKKDDQATLSIYVTLESINPNDDAFNPNGVLFYMDKYYVSDPAGTTNGAWMKTAGGNWWYCNADRTYTRNNWQKINRRWYYFDENGYMVKGWRWIKGADGKERCYYMYTGNGSNEGACMMNGTTPDGWTVDSTGAWTLNGLQITKEMMQ